MRILAPSILILFLLLTCGSVYYFTKKYYERPPVIYPTFGCGFKTDTIYINNKVWVVKYKTKVDTLKPVVFEPKVIIYPLANPDSFKRYEDRIVWQKVDNMPSFPGGEQEMMKYLSKNVYYPDVAYNNGVEGRVIISFIVNANGKISDVEVIKEIGLNCGTVCKQVVSEMPDWSIPTNKGYPVRVKLYLPIDFSLK